ncbi:MAG: hypothetical protein HYT34_01255, partial [Candidatus Ryanbacteria bacterium]|nr:hypothetical protein [Candidatus Ryanbacteria bacterium]
YRVAKKRPAIKQEQDIAPSEFGGAVARLSGIEFDWQIRPGKKSGSVTLARMLTEGLKKPKEELKQISSKDLEAVRIHMSDKTVWKIKFDKKSGFKLHRRVPGAQVVQNIDRKTLEDFQRQQRELVIEANEKRRRIIEKHIEKPAIDEEEEDRLLRELGSIGKKF